MEPSGPTHCAHPPHAGPGRLDAQGQGGLGEVGGPHGGLAARGAGQAAGPEVAEGGVGVREDVEEAAADDEGQREGGRTVVRPVRSVSVGRRRDRR